VFGTTGMPGNGTTTSSTFIFAFSLSEPHQYHFSGGLVVTPASSAFAALSGPGVSHAFSTGSFDVTGWLMPGSYTVQGRCTAGGVGIGGTDFTLALQVPAPAAALVAPWFLLVRRRRTME
jgi:hypothetical protein